MGGHSVTQTSVTHCLRFAGSGLPQRGLREEANSRKDAHAGLFVAISYDSLFKPPPVSAAWGTAVQY